MIGQQPGTQRGAQYESVGIMISIVMRFIITSYHQVSIINYHEVLCS